MAAILIQPPARRWECLRCPTTDVTHEVEPHTRMHNCAALGGFTTPMVPAGTKGKLVLHVREDYVGGEDVRYDSDGRPIMSAEVVRDDGNDVAVYAPTAYADGYAASGGNR